MQGKIDGEENARLGEENSRRAEKMKGKKRKKGKRKWKKSKKNHSNSNKNIKFFLQNNNSAVKISRTGQNSEFHIEYNKYNEKTLVFLYIRKHKTQKHGV